MPFRNESNLEQHRKGENLRGGSMGYQGEKTVNTSPKIFANEVQLTEYGLLHAITEFLQTNQ